MPGIQTVQSGVDLHRNGRGTGDCILKMVKSIANPCISADPETENGSHQCSRERSVRKQYHSIISYLLGRKCMPDLITIGHGLTER